MYGSDWLHRCTVPLYLYPSNVAEGQAQHTAGAIVQFVSHAEGSLAELDIQLTIAVQLGYCILPNIGETSALMGELRKCSTPFGASRQTKRDEC
jgi:four helix bundle protein